MAVEAAAYHQERLRCHPDDYRPCITGLLEEGIACSAPDYARARQHQTQMRQEMADLLTGVDALICPATTVGAPGAVCPPLTTSDSPARAGAGLSCCASRPGGVPSLTQP